MALAVAGAGTGTASGVSPTASAPEDSSSPTTATSATTASAGAVALSADEGAFPRAEAGLDQTVQRNASVLLDATESYAPGGELVDYNWEITTPSGTTITTSCDTADCGRGRFRARELGEYSVTVTVEDDAGRTESDTLYVTVVPRGSYGVELRGPADAADSAANLTATISPGDATVRNITWYRADQELSTENVSALGGVYNHSAYIAPGSTYRVVVADRWNRTVSDTWTAPGGSSFTPSGPSSSQYPRIEGPSAITGSPDRITNNDKWIYNGMDYVVRTSEYGSVERSIWGINDGDSGDYVEDESLFKPELHPGVNTIVANLELEMDRLGRFRDHGSVNATTLDRINGTATRDVVLRRPVVVDPAPQLDNWGIERRDESIDIRFDGHDAYNPPSRYRINVGGDTVRSGNIESNDIDVDVGVLVPDSVSGSTTVEFEVVDSRGQTISRSENYHFDFDVTSYDRPVVSYMPAAKSSHGGTSPISHM